MKDFEERTHDIKEGASNLYHTAKDKTAEVYHDTKEHVEELADHIKHSASDLYQSGKEQFTKLEGCLQDCSQEFIKSVKDKPVTSLLIAGGVGFIVAMLLKKR